VAHKIKAITDFPRSNTIIQLRRFLAMLNYYCRHLKRADTIQAPLNELLKDSKKNDKKPVSWITETINAFINCKKELTQAILLTHPIEGTSLLLSTDASDIAIGASLEQVSDNKLTLLAFFSKKLSKTQRKYSTYDRKFPAIYESIKYFKDILQGCRIIIKTDHK